MRRKASCDSTEYTGGFRITVLSDGTFVGVKDEAKLRAGSAKELYELIKQFNQDHP
jgi:hypothetical protein